jgi:hypothetical protein
MLNEPLTFNDPVALLIPTTVALNVPMIRPEVALVTMTDPLPPAVLLVQAESALVADPPI